MLNGPRWPIAAPRAVATWICALVVLGCACTSKPPTPPPADPWSTDPTSNRQASEEEIESSDELLDGSFELASAAEPSVAASYVFTKEGAFSRTYRDASADTPRVQSGTYLVTKSGGGLVLYVERSGGAVYSTAVSEALGLRKVDAESLMLTEDGVEATYRRTGPAPAKSAGGPSAE
jgi:hypothetical protein